MAFTQIICCADSDAEAERLYGDAVKYFHRNESDGTEFGNPPGYSSTASLRHGSGRFEQVANADQRARAGRSLSFWEYDDLGYIIAGTPERVEQRVRELVTELRIGQLITCMHVGNLPEEVAALRQRAIRDEGGAQAPGHLVGVRGPLDATDHPAPDSGDVPGHSLRALTYRSAGTRAPKESFPMPHVTVNGISLYYEEAGAGPPLLLISGLGANHSRYAPVVPVLSPRYRVITFDNRGTGKSAVPPGPYRIEDLAADTAALIDHLGTGPWRRSAGRWAASSCSRC